MGLYLFVDGSVDPQRMFGCGAMLLLERRDGRGLDVLKREVSTHRFEPTNSSRLELQTLLWALGKIGPRCGPLVVFTDSQTIAGLAARRRRLEANRFCSSAGKNLSNSDLYREFYDVLDRMKFEIVKVKGHCRSSERNRESELFALVDKTAREALRRELP